MHLGTFIILSNRSLYILYVVLTIYFVACIVVRALALVADRLTATMLFAVVNNFIDKSHENDQNSRSDGRNNHCKDVEEQSKTHLEQKKGYCRLQVVFLKWWQIVIRRSVLENHWNYNTSHYPCFCFALCRNKVLHRHVHFVCSLN